MKLHITKRSLLAGACMTASLLAMGAMANGVVQGQYTEAQAAAGAEIYRQNCSGCHQPDLAGQNEALPLVGSSFMSTWRDRSIADIYTLTRGTMPRGAPRSLSNDAYAQLVAYMLQANGAPSGALPLDPTSATRIGTVATGRRPVTLAQAPAPSVASAAASRPRDGIGGFLSNSTPPLATSGLTVSGTLKSYRPVTDEMLRNPPPGDWLMARRNYEGWSSSPLKQISPQNVKDLKLQWVWAMNEGGASQVTPIVHDGIIFLSNTSNTIQALDGRTGDLIWENRIGPVATSLYSGTRSLSLYKDKVFVGTTDARLYALDTRTGKIVWDADVGERGKGYGNAGAIMVMNGKVVAGLTGCSRFARTGCYISGYDAATGKQLWKFYTTARAGTRGGDTWNNIPDMFRAGGETWIAGSYDPALNLTYWGIAQAKPWLRASRGTADGAALYTSSTVALNPDTGELKWHHSHAPGESLDLDEVFERVLLDLDGQKTLFTMGKVGILWKLDRVTGKFLGYKETVLQNVFT